MDDGVAAHNVPTVLFLAVLNGTGRKASAISGNMNINALCFKSRPEWRAWLEENHARESEVWLVHSKKGSTDACLALGEAVEEAICFGWIDSRLMSIDRERYALRYTPRRPGSVWSMSNRERAERLIECGKMAPAGMATVEEARRRGLWDAAYTDRTDVPLPSDLREGLLANELAWANFQQFPRSQRNMYVRWVVAAKTEATRRKRITEVTRRSGLNRRPGI